jgi:hypothetical protein
VLITVEYQQVYLTAVACSGSKRVFIKLYCNISVEVSFISVLHTHSVRETGVLEKNYGLGRDSVCERSYELVSRTVKRDGHWLLY